MPLIKTIRTLATYLLVAFMLFWDYYGLFFILQFPFIRVNKYCFSTWYVIDVLVCHVAHGTGSRRSISGWTGQHMSSKKRYMWQSKLIDLAFGKNHCQLEYVKERDRGYVKD